MKGVARWGVMVEAVAVEVGVEGWIRIRPELGPESKPA